MARESETDRRRAGAEAQETDWSRWRDPGRLDPAWDARAKLAAAHIPAGARVLDLGCGAMALERFLPPYCTYLPCDLTARDERTRVCDFNAGDFPADTDCDIAVALGVLEYLTDVAGFLKKLRGLNRPVVLSYNVAGEGNADRRALGWFNDFTRPELPGLIREAGFTRATARELGGGQVLMRLEPDAPARRAEKTVWALSYSTVANFGDRLGVQVLASVLPAHACVRHISHEALPGPDEPAPDLLILGLGNSLYADLLTDELQALVARAPAAIGVFGTQYREVLPADRLSALIERLDLWYARYEDDALIYGRGRDNVRHLGDWLVDAFPMARPDLDEQLQVKSAEINALGLDRAIAYIQRFRQVSSGRLHPLLCALTSAEHVAYREQHEHPSGGPSGKFRSLLIDVFGAERPEDQLWPVDRSAVVAYKQRVSQNLMDLRAELARRLA